MHCEITTSLPSAILRNTCFWLLSHPGSLPGTQERCWRLGSAADSWVGSGLIMSWVEKPITGSYNWLTSSEGQIAGGNAWLALGSVSWDNGPQGCLRWFQGLKWIPPLTHIEYGSQCHLRLLLARTPTGFICCQSWRMKMRNVSYDFFLSIWIILSFFSLAGKVLV